MSDDIRRLLESISRLSEQPAPNVVQLPLPAPRGVPAGQQAFGRIGQELTKPTAVPTVEPKAPAVSPGQKSLFNLPKAEIAKSAPSTAAPWLDPKGAKDPAYLRKAAAAKAPINLGPVGGTGPTAASSAQKVTQLRTPTPNVSQIKPTPGALSKAASALKPLAKLGGVAGSAATYAAPLGPQVPQIGKLKGSEINPSTGKGWTAQEISDYEANPNVQPAPEPAQVPELKPVQHQTEPLGPKTGAPARVPVPIVPPTVMDRTAYNTEKAMRAQGAIKEALDEFNEHLRNTFPGIKEQGLPGLLGRMLMRGKKPPATPPTVTPQKPVEIPKDVETPAYIRQGMRTDQPVPGATPPAQPAPAPQVGTVTKPGTAANAPTVNQPAVFKQNPERAAAQAARKDQELLQTRPGADGKPISPPKPDPLIPKPEPGKPGSVSRQRRKLIPPATAIGTGAGTGGGDGSSATGQNGQPQGAASSGSTPPVDLDKVMWVDTVPPTSSATTPAAPEAPASEPHVTPNPTPLTKDQLDVINHNDREAEKARAEKERAQAQEPSTAQVKPLPIPQDEPTKPATAQQPKPQPAPSVGTGKTDTGPGADGDGTGGPAGGFGTQRRSGYDTEKAMRSQGAIKENSVSDLLKEFEKFVNK